MRQPPNPQTLNPKTVILLYTLNPKPVTRNLCPALVSSIPRHVGAAGAPLKEGPHPARAPPSDFCRKNWIRYGGIPRGLGFRVPIGVIFGLYKGYVGIMEKKMETNIL